jgi:hypothetical protein
MSAIGEEKRPLGTFLRALIATIALIMVPPFIALAIAPMVLVLAPVALVAIPFMLSAFAVEAREVQPAPRAVRALSHAHS